MLLLRSLHTQLCGVADRWTPSEYPAAAHACYEILISEETDKHIDAKYEAVSHFEYYVYAMKAAGADISPINNFVTKIRNGFAPATALESRDVRASSKAFARATLGVASGPVAKTAGALCFGREGIIPNLFKALEKALPDLNCLTPFKNYLLRHVHLDAKEHGPASQLLLERVISRDSSRMRLALDGAELSLKARHVLLDSIEEEIVKCDMNSRA
jgi:hypothetical protein